MKQIPGLTSQEQKSPRCITMYYKVLQFFSEVSKDYKYLNPQSLYFLLRKSISLYLKSLFLQIYGKIFSIS